jgi:hypothetical protein
MGLRGLAWLLPPGLGLHAAGFGPAVPAAGALMPVMYAAGLGASHLSPALLWGGQGLAELLWGATIWLTVMLAVLAGPTAPSFGSVDIGPAADGMTRRQQNVAGSGGFGPAEDSDDWSFGGMTGDTRTPSPTKAGGEPWFVINDDWNGPEQAATPPPPSSASRLWQMLAGGGGATSLVDRPTGAARVALALRAALEVLCGLALLACAAATVYSAVRNHA